MFLYPDGLCPLKFDVSAIDAGFHILHDCTPVSAVDEDTEAA